MFTGRRFDPEAGMYDYRNRYYAPELGRFVSRDPVLDLLRNLSRYGESDLLRALLYGLLTCETDADGSGQCVDFSGFLASLSVTLLQYPLPLSTEMRNSYAFVNNNPVGRTDPTGLGLIGWLKCVYQIRKWQKKCMKDLPKCDDPCMTLDEYMDCLQERRKAIKKCMKDSQKMFKTCIKAVKPVK